VKLMTSKLGDRNTRCILPHNLLHNRTLNLSQDLIEQVVEKRVKASSDIEHWKRKRAEEEAAINDAEQVSNTTETELAVGVHYPLMPSH
jgi:hypothetical protein